MNSRWLEMNPNFLSFYNHVFWTEGKISNTMEVQTVTSVYVLKGTINTERLGVLERQLHKKALCISPGQRKATDCSMALFGNAWVLNWLFCGQDLIPMLNKTLGKPLHEKAKTLKKCQDHTSRNSSPKNARYEPTPWWTNKSRLTLH